MHGAVAVLLANLPVRWWGPFEERYPLYRMAWMSGLLAMLVGIAIGIPGYLAFVQRVSGDVNSALIGAQSDLVQVPGWGVLSLPIFLLTTPLGLASMYLTASGFLRAAGAYLADDVRGDYLLTAVDGIVRRVVAHEDRVRQAATREALEGPAVPDRLVTGAQIGHPEFELVILAARQKPGWEPNAYLVTPDGRAFRLGLAFDFRSHAGLRAAYPLTELRTLDPIRHSIPYDLPAAWPNRKV